MANYTELLQDAASLAKQAGDIQLTYFRQPKLDVATKSNAFDVVTAADKASEQAIIAGIKAKYPSHSILSEEAGESDGASDYEWVIDPLDGTSNFNAGLPQFNVSIGIRHKDETVAGVVYAPRYGEMFQAIKGHGATLNGQAIHASGITQLDHAVVSTGFPYDKAVNPDNNLDNASRVLPRVRGLRRLGAAALDIAYVAAGFLDAYWEINLQPWDVCAGALIASEAGAVVKRFRPDRSICLMAAAPGIASQLAALLGNKQP